MSLYRCIPLGGKRGVGKFAKIDSEDYEKVSQHSWSVGNRGYVIARINGKIQKLHRFVTNAPDGLQVDHEKHDRLDNRKSKLRLCSNSQNAMNRRPHTGSSLGLKGAYPHAGRFAATICIGGKQVHLGTYDLAEDAGKAYDAAARFYFGEFAHTNYIGDEALSAAVICARAPKFNRAGYKGVFAVASKRNPWKAQGAHAGKRISLGVFATREEAARAHDDFRVSIGKPRINFPD